MVCDFQIYTKKVDGKAQKLLGPRIVKDLCEVLRNGYYQVYFDNCCTSIDLMILKSDKILACETVRKDRVGLPIKIKKNLDQSENEYRTSHKGIQRV